MRRTHRELCRCGHTKVLHELGPNPSHRCAGCISEHWRIICESFDSAERVRLADQYVPEVRDA